MNIIKKVVQIQFLIMLPCWNWRLLILKNQYIDTYLWGCFCVNVLYDIPDAIHKLITDSEKNVF